MFGVALLGPPLESARWQEADPGCHNYTISTTNMRLYILYIDLKKLNYEVAANGTTCNYPNNRIPDLKWDRARRLID